MRVVVITKDNTEYSRMVTTFINDFARQTGQSLEVLDPEWLLKAKSLRLN